METTRACLRGLISQRNSLSADLQFFITDDLSTDNTVEMIRETVPDANLMLGDGNLYWNGAMRNSWLSALETNCDGFLLINDDVILEDFALDLLLCRYEEARNIYGECVVVGETTSSSGDVITYGGRRERKGVQPLVFDLVDPGNHIVQCDTGNGNFMLVPRTIVQKIGILGAVYTQRIGDYDYGLRAKKAGFGVIAIGPPIGKCDRNPVSGTYIDPAISRIRRFRNFVSVKGYPLLERLHFNFRHAGIRGVLLWFATCIKWTIIILTGTSSRRLR